MKKFFYLLPAVALLFAACSDSDDKVKSVGVKAGDIKNAPAKDAIDAVKLVIDANKVLSTTEWNDGFTLEFPETVADANLETVKKGFESAWTAEQLKNITISDENAKVCFAGLRGYKGTETKGDFYIGDASGDREVIYVYSDRKVSIKGTIVNTEDDDDDDDDDDDFTYTYKVDVNLKKGWNEVAAIGSETANNETYELTSSIPAGLSWHYDSWSSAE